MIIDQPPTEAQPAPLWRLAFRAGFLLAAAFAVASMGRWLFWIRYPGDWSGPLSPHWWHGHEMIFGFAMPVVTGFLLTAVATWTGVAGTRGLRLQILFGLWLCARLLLWLAPSLSWLAWMAESAFIFLTLYELTTRVWARRQWRNMLFPPVLLVLWLLCSVSYLAVDDALLATRLHYGAIWMITVLVVIIGGRVTPLFTGNRLGLKIAPHPLWFDYLAIGSVALVALSITLVPARSGATYLQGLSLVTAAIHLYRMARWQGWKTHRVPLLWSMHLSYLCIPLALIGLATAGPDPVAVKNIVHLLAIGTVGGMILAMMSRVSLGHTGRPLETPGYLSAAFALLLLAAILRALLPILVVELTPAAWLISASLWTLAFTAFLVRYTGVLCSPRADNKPG